MIIDILRNCVKQLDNERQTQINLARDKATREIIAPHNAEKDNKRNLAIQELTADRDSRIKAIQEQYERDKQTLFSIGEQEKAKFAEVTIESETALVSIAYDSAIAELNKQIEKESGNKE